MLRMFFDKLIILLSLLAVIAWTLLTAGCSEGSNNLNDTGYYGDTAEVHEASAKSSTWNARNHLVLEAFYALNSAHTGSSSKTYTGGGGTWLASDWNYLNSDTSALSTIQGWYPSPYGSSSSYYYSNPSYYGYRGGYGYGGQCKGFANLIAYRSGAYTSKFPVYSSWCSSYRGTSARCAQKGDIIWRSSTCSTTGHVAVVVDVLSGSSSSCTVTSVDVVDSNQAGNERILRHIINTSGTYFGEDLDNYYVFTGITGYSTPYDESSEPW